MTSFKISKKIVHTDSRTSIIDKHVETIKKIEYDKKNIDKYQILQLKNLSRALLKTFEVLDCCHKATRF